MATRRKRKGGRRRIRARSRRSNPINPLNPVRRRRRSTRRRVHARRRHNPINPVRRRHVRRRRHRNPLGAAGGEVLNFTVAGLSLGIAQPILTRFVGGMLPFGQYNAPVLAAGTGWALSQVFKMFGFTRRFSHPALVFGLATAAMQILQPIVRGAIGAGGAGVPMQGWGSGQYGNWQRRPMRGIGVTTNIPPVIQSMPIPPQVNGMSGMGMRPGVYGR